MRNFFMLLLCLVTCSTQVWAQNRTISGKVSDAKTGEALRGVTVTSGGTSALSDVKGNYQIKTSGKSISFMIVGYEASDVQIGKATTINVTLNTTSKALEEVVITGYSRERKTQFAGAATVLGSKAVETVPVGAFDQALQGKVPGMLVNSGSGQPGSSASVTIRGVQSITGAGAQPLYVLDGVPLPAFDMATINANDFETITILKDANAAALYGARAGTGVIVITTKRGKAGQTNFQYRTQMGITSRPSFTRMNLMNTKEMIAYEEREKIPGTPGWVYSALNPAIPTGYTAAMKQTSLDSIRNIDVDYANIFFRQGISQTHELNMSGGTDKTKYYLAAGYFNQQGIDLGSELKRYTLRFNLDHTYDKLTVGFNTTVGYSQSKLSEGELYGNSARNPFQMTYRAKNYENPYKPDGSLNFGASTSMAIKSVANLLEGIQNSMRNSNNLKINGAGSVAYKVLPSFTLKTTMGVDVSSYYSNRYINANSYIGALQFSQNGLAQEGYNLTSQFISTSSAIFAKKFGKHEVETGGYFEVVRGFDRGLGFTLYNLDPRLTQTGQGASALATGGAATYPQNATSAKGGFGIRSYFGTARYTFNNKYSINGNIRRDGTSRIVNQDNREITTWSAGFIWNAIQEDFLSKFTFLSDLKVRASYGIVPNIGSIPTASFGTYLGSVANYQGPQVPTFGTTAYAGSTIGGLAPSTPGNPNLKIENIQKTNIGLDFAVWNNRARFTVDLYRNKTVDLFVSQPLSGTTGFGSLNVNAGIMTNKGIELLAKVDVVKTNNIGVTLGLNHSINKNNIDDLGLVNEYFLGTFVIRKGLPYGSHYTYNYLGADAATGNPIYETADGKTTFDISKAGQFAKFGTYLPKHVGGFDFELRYKMITISGLFSYQFDVVRSNNTRNWITRGTPGYQQSVRGSRELIENQWQKPGDVKMFQASKFDRGFTSSDLEDAKFLRLRNLMVSYQLPEIKATSGKVIIKSARFYVQGQNLAIWSPWRGLDPEDNNNISLNEYPNPRMIVSGLDINF